MELIDILDENGNKIGVEPRDKVHRDGLLHRAIHIWIYNSKNEILIQRRAKTKDSFPDFWDISVGGHASAGETYETAALKELEEELGLKVNLKDLELFKNQTIEAYLPEINWHDKELNRVYFLKYGGDIKELKLQKEEVEEVKFVKIEELEKLISNPVTKKEFCPHGDYSYYHEIISALRTKPL
jgi:isopentenyl-diphosphate Delta-isomerase